MGISGLLPALKSIQDTKHLSEFAGQTLAVDAYVWLHRGVLGCATELATGRDTHKYVNYAMERVRLLRYHKIEPYIVFDGGPLPAKKGTEIERKQRREESLKKGNALAAQGKHTQARECYVKCVDVTPQMAFQFIKALREESVAYVVAPYEADAQLAYLERIGLVDGIITEDSDLLVFGCRNVLFKFDMVARTVVNIKRGRFASVSASATDSNGISLVGWSDKQFRAMAILSGCDYLPSIPGIGLKTACSLLRKWKTVEQVIRTIALEGKKSVPRGYLNQFRLAEKCFLHQRVYCPRQEKLVHLSDVDETWDSEAEAYVGGDIEPSLAKKIALGDADPVTLLPMNDINPNFVPRALKRPAPVSLDSSRKEKGKGKEKATPAKDGILSFFGPTPTIPPRKDRHISSPIRLKRPIVGKASGKRTLAEVMDQDLAATRKQRSKFFASPKPKVSPRSRQTNNGHPPSVAGPSRLSENKENVYIVIDDDEEVDVDSGVSMVAQGKVDPEMMQDVDEPSGVDVVEQEDGYISPTPSYSGELQDLSSPIRPGHTPITKRREADHDFGADTVSSPPSQAKRRFHPTTRELNRTRSLNFSSAGAHSAHQRNVRAYSKADAEQFVAPCSSFPGPDLRHSFGDDDIDCSDDDTKGISRSASSPTPTPSPVTPMTQEDVQPPDAFGIDEPSDPEESNARANELRKQAVIDGWRNQWALNKNKNKKGVLRTSERPKLVRRETNVTPAGRHSLGHIQSRFRPYPLATPQSAPAKTILQKDIKPRRAQSRKSLPFFEAVRSASPSAAELSDLDFPDCDITADEAPCPRITGLERFRCA